MASQIVVEVRLKTVLLVKSFGNTEKRTWVLEKKKKFIASTSKFEGHSWSLRVMENKQKAKAKE